MENNDQDTYNILLDPKEVDQAFIHLVDSIKSKSDEVPAVIFQAMEVAQTAHTDQKRKDGSPYILHPIAVAQILCDMNMPPILIAAGLLHDVVEDCEDKGFTLEKIKEDFGQEMGKLVQSVTKVSLAQKKIIPKEYSHRERKEYEADETMKKLMIHLADDSRAIIIKLADRLHNMRTLEYVSTEHKIRKSIETLNNYSPLASALGFNQLKSELDDICFRYKLPEQYDNISEKLKKLTEKNRGAISSVKDKISSLLKKRPEIPAFTIDSRIKSTYGIFQKMMNNNLPFESVYDIFGLRIIYKASSEKEESYWAWRIFAEIASEYRQKEDRIRDFILKPRGFSGYQALHLTILDPSLKTIEIQIRSQRMHLNAELGGANHYDYKAKKYQRQSEGSKTFTSKKNAALKLIKEALTTGDTSTLEVSQEFYRGSQEMVVYTQSDEYRTIASGASVLDFAFKVHSQLMKHFDHAFVNGNKVDAAYILKPYDKVSIVTNANITVNALFLRKAQLSSTRSEIRKTLRKEKEQIIALGEIKLRRYLRVLIKNKLGNKKSLFDLNQDSITHKMVHYFGLHESSRQSSFNNPVNELHYKIEKSIISRTDIINFVDYIFSNPLSLFKYIRDIIPGRSAKKPTTNKLYPINAVLFGPTREIKNYNISHCCKPIVGDEIKAIEHFDYYMVHKKHCEKHPKNNTVISATWDKSENAGFFIEIVVRSSNQKNILKKILTPIYAKISQILNLVCSPVGKHHHMTDSHISFFCPDYHTLRNIIQRIERITNIRSVMITSKSD